MSDREASTGSQAESPFVVARTPRLSILHLMLWTLCSSVYLTLFKAIYSFLGVMPSGYASLRDASSALEGVIAGAVIAGSIVLVSTRVRKGPPMLRQPGHWFLVISALTRILYMPALFVSMLTMRGSEMDTWYLLVYGVVIVVPLIAYSVAARCNRDRRWKLLFVAFALMALTQCIHLGVIGAHGGRDGSWFGVLSAISSLGSVLLAGAVVAVSIFDIATGLRRDWLHWTGVATHVATSSVSLLWMVRFWLIR